ncbi:MAG: hypothetical protein ACI9CD_001186 [Candidatus Deianiraeaceae bacterium]|jgi:hypothetical protein
MEDKIKVKSSTKKDLQKKIKVNTKDNFKDTLDAMLMVNIEEVSNKKGV